MYIEDIYSTLSEVISTFREALEEESGAEEIMEILSSAKKQLFRLCEAIDEEGVEDGDDEALEDADAITDVIDMIEDLIGAIDDNEVDDAEIYDEIEEIVNSLSEISE